MFDIWGFLLQTLSISGVAMLILVVKALFKDKLPPKWQFAVWGVLGIVILIPAGIGGRYVLFRWQLVVEVIKSWFGDFSFTRIWLPVPVITKISTTVSDWIFALYALGILVHIFKYVISYLNLKRVLRMGDELGGEKLSRIQMLATERGIKMFKVIEVYDLPSAFVYGVFQPVLVLPANSDVDEKIILHELFHLKNKDTLWSVIICLLRCLHWCNPLIVYCANRALNDMESRCDQYVLENLQGEERREYGLILLSMANERFSKTPGSTCINNGGKNIRERIENIARFKKYPQGMQLVSICVVILLTFPLVVGAQSAKVVEFNDSVRLTLASARSIPCTTPAGAFDAYGKAILDRNGYYRAMCAPEDIQDELLLEMVQNEEFGIYPLWNPGLDEWTNAQSGYYIYNLKKDGNNAYEGLFVVELSYPPDGKAEKINTMYLAVQNLRVQKQNGRWVTIPLESFRHVETLKQSIAWGCTGLPGITYVGETNNIRTELSFQTIHTVDSTVTNQNDNFLFDSSSYYDKTPKPNAKFTSANGSYNTKSTFLGTDAEKDLITHIGLSIAPVYEGEKRPAELHKPIGDYTVSSSSTGELWISKKLNSGWGPVVTMDGGGSSYDPKEDIELPLYYAADLYLNNECVAEFDLTLQKGEAE
ncbi:MAG: hypothetical protein IJY23_02850 [Clostridia bacterium]|nr:hypothetical protein [Clostridia bacterium]